MVVPPTLTLKAQKNSIEIDQMIAANILDGVALTDWMAFIETEVSKPLNDLAPNCDNERKLNNMYIWIS